MYVYSKLHEVLNENFRIIKENLEIKLSIKTIADFLSFEEVIETSEVKKKL